MSKVTVTQIENLSEDEPDRRYKLASTLGSLRIKAVLTNDDSSYDMLTNSICDAAIPLLARVQKLGFASYLLLIGPILSKERKSKISNYSLSNSLTKRGISIILSHENIYTYADGERVVGLYHVRWEDFKKYCLFLVRSSWAIGLLSKQEKFISSKNVEALYKTARLPLSDMVGLDINWVNISDLVCPRGDIVIKTFGAYDDRQREINFIHTAQDQSTMLFPY